MVGMEIETKNEKKNLTKVEKSERIDERRRSAKLSSHQLTQWTGKSKL